MSASSRLNECDAATIIINASLDLLLLLLFFLHEPSTLLSHKDPHLFSFQGSLLGYLLVLCMLVYNMVLLYVCIETIMIF